MTELEPYWLDEADWIVLVEFLSPDDAEDRARGAEAIGYLFGYAQMTDTRMLALVGDPDAGAYELLFSFSTPAMKTRFLELVQSNEATNCEEDDIMVPVPSEIAQARPLAMVLPDDVVQRATVIAIMLIQSEDAESAN